MKANQAAKNYISKLEELKKQSYEILLAQLKELGATPDKPIKFDWFNQYAPCIIANCFDDDVADCYVKSIYADGDLIYVSLWSYYQQCSTEYDLLTDVCTDYDDIIEYLIDWSWDDNYDNEDWEDDDDFDDKHVIVDTSYGEVMLKQKDGFVECYIGDNYDDYIGDIDAYLENDNDYLINLVENLLDKNL